MRSYLYLLINLNRYTFQFIPTPSLFSNIEADVIEKATKEIRRAASILSKRKVAVDPQLLHSAVEHQILHALSKYRILPYRD